MKEKAMDSYLIWDEQSQSYVMDSEQRVRDDVEKHHWQTVARNLIRDWRLYLMLVPMLLVFLFWRYMPMYELLGCFKLSDTSLSVNEQNFVGFSNFLRLLSGGESVLFWRAFRNTFLLSFYGLCFGFPMPIILALFFNEVKSNVTRSVFQVFTYLPKFMSTVVITSLTLLLLQGASTATGTEPGVISNLLVSLGVISQETANIGMMNNPLYFRAVYQITGIWEGAGYDSIVFFAAIIAISPTSYEAAQIDGAGKMAQMRYVVLPSILSTVVIMLIMRIGSLLSIGYEKVFLLYNNNTYETADVVSTFAMRLGNVGTATGGSTSAPGLASAAEMMNNVTGMLLVIGANLISKKASNVSLY